MFRKLTILTCLIINLNISTFGQCDLINDAHQSYSSKNYDLSISLLEKCKVNTDTYLNQKIEFQIGICYELLGEDSTANSIFEQLYNSYIFSSREQIDSTLDCEKGTNNWLDFGGQVYMYHSIMRKLFELSIKDSSYYKALGYLKKMDSVNLMNYCGNAAIGQIHLQILRYAEVYDKMSKPDSALMQILPYLINYNIWENRKINEYAIKLISKNHNISEVKREFEESVKKIKTESFIVNIEKFVRLDIINPAGPAVYEVKPILIKSYSMIFMGVKMILLNDKNHYSTERVPTTVREMKKYCFSTEFYKSLKNSTN